MNKTATITASLVTLAITGCSNFTSYKSGEAIKTIYGAHVDDIAEKYGSNDKLSAAIDAVNDGDSRNRLMNDLIFLIDTNYDLWEKNIYNKKAYSDFGSDFASASLNSVGATLGAKAAKTTLSLIAGGITGAKADFNADVLQSQTLLAVITKMRASRAAQLLVLQKGMYVSNSTSPTPLDAYSIDQGMNDLVVYYEAGTFVDALQDIIAKSGAENIANTQTLKDLKGAYSFDDAAKSLRNYWKPGGVNVNTANAAALNKWLATNDPGVDIWTFLYNPQYASDRVKAVSALVK